MSNMPDFGWLEEEAARQYVRDRAEEFRRLREVLTAPDSVGEEGVEIRAPRGTPFSPNPRASSRIIDHVEHWWCPGCQEWIPRKLMGRRSKRWNGLDVYCRKCKRQQTNAVRGKKNA